MADRKAELPDQAGGSNWAGALRPRASKAASHGSVRRTGCRSRVRFFDDADRSRLPLLCLPGLSRNSRDFIALGQFFAEHPTSRGRSSRSTIAAAASPTTTRTGGTTSRSPRRRMCSPPRQPSASSARSLSGRRAAAFSQCSSARSSGAHRRRRPERYRPGHREPRASRGSRAILASRDAPSRRGTQRSRRSARRAKSQYPGSWNEDWRALAAAYYGETRERIRPALRSQSSQGHRGHRSGTERYRMLWPQFMSLARVPVLAIRGALSDILSAQTLAEMAERHPRLESLTVERQGMRRFSATRRPWSESAPSPRAATPRRPCSRSGQYAAPSGDGAPSAQQARRQPALEGEIGNDPATAKKVRKPAPPARRRFSDSPKRLVQKQKARREPGLPHSDCAIQLTSRSRAGCATSHPRRPYPPEP